MNALLNSKYGCYIAGGIPFLSKFQALNHASQTNSGSVIFYYHNHVWENFDRSKLGKISLETLYKERALQLRDRYDYLVLHYSGGSDSHNILHTFITNKIKLDEVYVRWAKPLIDKKFYTPNNIDFSATNSPSEWDYTIKPSLEKLKISNPEIKITIADFTENFNNLGFSKEKIQNVLFDMNLTVGAFGTIAQRIDNKIKISKIESQKIGHIFGVEKPILYVDNKSFYMAFQDSMLEVATLKDLRNNETSELFYWAPDFPNLIMEMAYQCSLYLKKSKDVVWRPNVGEEIEKANIRYRRYGYKSILYKNSWDFKKFQVMKPNASRSDWWSWLHNSSQLDNFNKNFQHSMQEVLGDIDPRYLMYDNQAPLMKPVTTKLFYITDL